ncbi:MAG: hypothetical protein R2736_22475 [Solirubrobacterales bacterium]
MIVTGEEDKSDTAKCNKARTTYNTARKNVNTARKKLAAAKSKAAKSRLTHQLNSAIKARARAAGWLSVRLAADSSGGGEPADVRAVHDFQVQTSS